MTSFVTIGNYGDVRYGDVYGVVIIIITSQTISRGLKLENSLFL